MISKPLSLLTLRSELGGLADSDIAAGSRRFFKTGAGQYGEGDQFLGIRVPVLRRLAKTFQTLPLEQVLTLLVSPWHEERLLALLILVAQYKHGAPELRELIFQTYLAHTAHINGWDLVDTSAEYIIGAHLEPKDFTLLKRLARSESVWERRIAILATFGWIKRGTFRPTLQVAELLLGDPHDLIHKAVGWMLREIGNRDRAEEEAFLGEHYRRMPRTMLRYAIERFPEGKRLQYLRGQV